MEIMSTAEAAQAIEAHAAKSGLKPTTIGQYALEDRHIYGRLKSGGAVHDKTLERLAEWLAKSDVRAAE